MHQILINLNLLFLMLLSFFDDMAILRGKREDDFAPVKNKEGVD